MQVPHCPSCYFCRHEAYDGSVPRHLLLRGLNIQLFGGSLQQPQRSQRALAVPYVVSAAHQVASWPSTAAVIASDVHRRTR